jgi:tRNA-2-methylthio-N6-dimethylallyladenosine synthase
MNEHDSRRMADVLRSHGYVLTGNPGDASLILVNTCSVRGKSQSKVLSALGAFRQLKERRPDLLLGVTGCVAEQEGKRLLAAAPYLDLVLGPDHIAELPSLVSRAAAGPLACTGFVDVAEYEFLAARTQPGQEPAAALVTIQKGCDNLCAYCIVPHVRGREASRPAEEILAEARALVAAGIREVTLIGQNVNSYHGFGADSGGFVELLRAVCETPGLARVRFTTSHPKDFSPALASCFGHLARLCPWLHLPVQSGSSSVLARMNRGYSRQDYLRCIAAVRAARPDVAIGTDVIVGFPGESHTEFSDTLSLIEQVRFDYIYSFTYSARPGTAAAQLADDVPPEVKAARLHELQRRQDGITCARLARFVGRELEVLVEGPSRRGPPQLSGRAPGNQVVNFVADGVRAGDLVSVLIDAAGRHSLSGRVVGQEARC